VATAPPSSPVIHLVAAAGMFISVAPGLAKPSYGITGSSAIE